VGLWALVLGQETEAHLAGLRAAGAIGGKLFWGYSFDRTTGSLVYDPSVISPERLIRPADAGGVRALFMAAASAELLIGVHCEDRAILDASAGDVDDYEGLLSTHPEEAETAAIAVAIELARITKARIHVLHVSSGRGVELVRHAKRDDIPVTAETCPHYLTMTAGDYPSVGSALKIFPPVRREVDRKALVAAVEDGTIDSIGSDHAPHSLEERSGGFGSQPAGAVALETMVPVVLDLVARGELSLHAAVRCLTNRTARVYGISRQKGRLEPGLDADITAVDMSKRWTIDAAALHSKAKMSPWHGREVTGKPTLTIVRGIVVMQDGELAAEPNGAFVQSGDDAAVS
jgi:dihydroorotase